MNIKDTFARNDEYNFEFLNEYISEIEKLIIGNPFSERIQHLLDNPKLATKKVVNLHDEESEPNCIGTALWIAGVSKLDYPYHAYENELNPHMSEKKTGNFHEDWITMMHGNSNNKISGAFNFSYCVQSDGWHAGIYLGEIKNKDILFAQHGHGNKFGIETEACYSSPKYYLPKTLKKS